MAIDDIISVGQKNRPAGSRRSASKALVFWGMALLAGATAAFLLKIYLDKRQAAVPTLTPVIVAATDLPLATTLKEEHLTVADWPRDGRPAGTFTEAKDLIGRVLISKTLKGEAILAPRLAAREAGSGLAALIPDNMRAAAVRVDDVVGVAGFIHPEDRVDVIVTMRPERGGETSSKVILQNVKVLAVGRQIEVEEKSRGKALPVTVATLLVSPEQSEMLALATAQGKLLLTLRSWTDEAAVPTEGIGPNDLLNLRAPVAAAPAAAPADNRRRPVRREVAHVPAAAPERKHETVEILRGDRFEERKFEAKEKP